MFKFVVLAVILVVVNATPFKRLSSMQPNGGRIVGGEDTTIENIPYQISLQIYGSHYCGGSIISKQWVITAGHCSEKPARSYTIRTGSTKHNSGGSVHKVTKIILHENYGSDGSGLPSNDIALMQVDVPFDFNEKRQPIGLFDQGKESTPGSLAVITGWGNTFLGFPQVLQRVEVPIVSKSECNDNYSSIGGLPDNQICAAYPEGGKDACQGDSGGPLVINGQLAGITSWGLGCAQAGYPGVYTEVAAYRTWINRKIQI